MEYAEIVTPNLGGAKGAPAHQTASQLPGVALHVEGEQRAMPARMALKGRTVFKTVAFRPLGHTPERHRTGGDRVLGGAIPLYVSHDYWSVWVRDRDGRAGRDRAIGLRLGADDVIGSAWGHAGACLPLETAPERPSPASSAADTQVQRHPAARARREFGERRDVQERRHRASPLRPHDDDPAFCRPSAGWTVRDRIHHIVRRDR